MEIMKFVSCQLPLSNRRTKCLGLVLFFMVILTHILHAHAHSQEDLWEVLRPDFFLCQMLTLLMVYTWIVSCPFFYTHVMGLGELFKEPRYIELARDHQQWIQQFSYISGGKITLKSWKLLYLLLWSSSWSYVVWVLFHYRMIPEGPLGWSMFVLIFLVLALNFSSYYTCIAFVYFLYRVVKLKDLRYNRFTPSATAGHQKLMRGAQNGSTMFLIVLLFLTFSGVIMTYGGLHRWKSDCISTEAKIHIGIMTFIVLFFGFGAFIILFLLPKFLMQSQVRAWRDQSLLKFQKDLYLAEDSGDWGKVERISQRIRTLMEDKVSLQFGFVEVLLVLTTILTNGASIAAFMLEIS